MPASPTTIASSTSTPRPPAPPTPSPTTPPLSNQYIDPQLNFSLSYSPGWTLDARDGTELNDQSGRTVSLLQDDYLLEIKAQFRPENPGGCGGVLHSGDDASYWPYQVDGLELWRPKLEQGFTRGYNDGSLTFASIIVPNADRSGFLCTWEMAGKLFVITYRLPLALEAIKAGQHRADLLAEMDAILQSIIWDTAPESASSAPTPTPLGYDATAPADSADGDTPTDVISQIKAANANQPEIIAPLPSPDGVWQAETQSYGCVEIQANQAMAYEALMLRNVNTGETQKITDQRQNCGGLGAGGLAALAWPPTSRYLYYTDARDGVPDGCGFWQAPILRWDRQTGETDRLGGGLISPDGEKLAFWPPRERIIVLWHLDQGELGRVSAPADAFPGPLAWSPDSQSLAYLQVTRYCPPEGASYLITVDVNTLEQDILLESASPTFTRLAWESESPHRLTLTDGQQKLWYYNLSNQTLEEAP